jgi:hypothetical protein
MSDASTKPVIFISYAHADEPETLAESEVKWLTFVQKSMKSRRLPKRSPKESARRCGPLGDPRQSSSPAGLGPSPAHIHINGLPETGYERLVGRDAELKRLEAVS